MPTSQHALARRRLAVCGPAPPSPSRQGSKCCRQPKHPGAKSTLAATGRAARRHCWKTRACWWSRRGWRCWPRDCWLSATAARIRSSFSIRLPTAVPTGSCSLRVPVPRCLCLRHCSLMYMYCFLKLCVGYAWHLVQSCGLSEGRLSSTARTASRLFHLTADGPSSSVLIPPPPPPGTHTHTHTSLPNHTHIPPSQQTHTRARAHTHTHSTHAHTTHTPPHTH